MSAVESVLNEDSSSTTYRFVRPFPGPDRIDSLAVAARRSVTHFSQGDVSFMEEQPRITDLIPRSYWSFLTWIASGGLVIAGLEALYHWMPRMAKLTGDGRIAAFDLDGEGSLAAWYSSFILILAAAVAGIIFSVRRHKEDDYYGRYRIWAWAAGAWLVMSIDESGSLHEGFKELMTVVSGRRLYGDGSIWWVAAYLGGLGWIGLRLVLEMRGCRVSTAVLMLSAGSFAAAVVTQLELILPESGAKGVMLEEGCEMAGGLLLLTAMGLHARYVLLESAGRIPVRTAKSKKARRAKSEESVSTATAGSSSSSPSSDLQTTPSKPFWSRPSTTSTASSSSTLRVDPPQSDLQTRKLSKAERKAMKRRMQQERHMDFE